MDSRVTEKYKLQKEIGKGAYGTVYLAQHRQLGELKAIKELIPKTAKEKKRVKREINILQQAQHPHVIKIDEVFAFEQATYICMEYAEKGSLEEKLKHHIKKDESLQIAVDILKGVQALHVYGIVHRDLKPGNILFAKDEKAKIGDFGIAKSDVNVSKLTKTGKTMGTIGYMAPEQLVGNKDEVDKQSDMYAVGVMLYEMLTGEHPFRGKNYLETVNRALGEKYRIKLEEYNIDKELQDICYKAIKKNKSKRYQQASEMLEDLSNYRLKNQSVKKKWISDSFIEKLQVGLVGIVVGMLYTKVGVEAIKRAESSESTSLEINQEYEELLKKDKKKEEVFRIVQKSIQREIYNGLQRGSEDNITEEVLRGDEFYNLGKIYYEGIGVEKDFVKAKELFGEGMKLGNSSSMNALGYIYANGLGVKKDYQKAKALYEKAIKLGNREALNSLGFMYSNGNGVKKDYSKAKELYEKATELGNSNGMSNLGLLYYQGHGVKKNYAKAKKLYERSARLDNSVAMNYLGNMYRNGEGVEKDYAKAKEYYEKAIVFEDSYAINNLGFMYLHGQGVEKDSNIARKYFNRSIRLGNSNGMVNLGFMYQNAYGVKQDYSKAKELYERAAQLGDSNGMVHLGSMYYYGYGLKKNYSKAKELYEKAAELGESSGMVFLGFIYQNALGVKKDYNEAKKFYEKAIELNDSSGMINLAFMYQSGFGVKKDYEKAKKLYEKAVTLGNTAGMNALGNMYLNGHGVEKSYSKAIELWRRSASLGDQNAIKYFKSAEKMQKR